MFPEAGLETGSLRRSPKACFFPASSLHLACRGMRVPALDASSFPPSEVSWHLRPSPPEEVPKCLPIGPAEVTFPVLKVSLWPGCKGRDWCNVPTGFACSDLISAARGQWNLSEAHGSGFSEQKEVSDGTKGKGWRPVPNTD